MPGVEGDIRAPHAKGDDSVYLLQSANLTVLAGTARAAQKWCEFTLPFACRCVKAEFVADILTDATSANMVITVQDDTATPIKFVDAAAVGASYAAGACVARSLAMTAANKAAVMLAGAIIRFIITSVDAGDLLTNGVVTLHLKPVN